MIKVRRSEDRGHFNHGWLETYHTFSFDQYVDPDYHRFSRLRVINEDFVAPGQGFPAHSHRDMEIITYILEGALEHKDSLGNTSVIRPGEVQRMSAGSGVTHSEYNASTSEKVHLLQIWIHTDTKGMAPGYEQKMFPAEKRRNRLLLVAAGKPENGCIKVHQDVRMFAANPDAGREIAYDMPEGRQAWIQAARGALTVNGERLEAGDGAAVTGEKKLTFHAETPAEFLLFDLP